MKYRHSYQLFGIVTMAIAGISASQATLEEYDATILAHETDQRISPSVIHDTPIVLDGSAGIPFDFGNLTLSATIEFVLSGELSSGSAAVLAVGGNTTWELRFDQHNDTGTLGFTHLGVNDYAFDFPSPQESTHIAYRYDAVPGVMELYVDGELHQLVSAPSYQMPSGQGFLGGRNATSIATMKGRIERLTTYNTALDPVIIGSHALAFRKSAIDPIAYGNDVSRETRVREESFIGNSVDTATGAFVQHLNLLLVEGGRDLGFSARYNSRLTDTPGALGYGWSHEYEAFIEEDGPGGIATVHWDKNRKNSFRFVANSQPYQPLDEAVRYAELDRQDSKWLVTTIDGSKWEFDASDGRLLRVANRTNLWLEMVYNGSGRLTEIVEPLGDYRITLEYNEADLLSRLEDDLGREIFLTYDEQHRLVRYAGPVIRDAALANSSFDVFNIPDNDSGGASGEIDIDLPGFVGLVSLQSATWTHPKPEDLQIWLVSPAGTRALVHDRTPATQANSLILADFDGEPRAGSWKVEAADLASGNAGGQITDFRMRFTEPSNAVNYTYGESHLLTAATDLFGEPLYSNTYDEQGRVLSQEDGLASSPIATFSYQTVGNTIRTTYQDRLGHEWIYVHDHGNHLLRIEDPLGNKTRFTYNEKGDRIKKTDALGRETHFDYDLFGNLTSIVDSAGFETTFTYNPLRHDLLTITDALGKTTTLDYGSSPTRSRGNIVKITDALGEESARTYTSSGLLESVDNGRLVEFERDRGKVFQSKNPNGAGDLNIAYDAVGRIIRSQNPNGVASTITYGATGNIIRQTDGRQRAQVSVYDHRDRLVKKIDRRDGETSFAFNRNNKLVSQTNALGETTTFEYDAEDHLVSSTDPAGKTARIVYDPLGRVVSQLNGEGHGNTLYYDAVGNVTKIVDPDGYTTMEMTYDARDLLVSTRDAFGLTASASYDAVGRKTSITDESGRVTYFTYDELDRLTEVEDPLGRIATRSYDVDDALGSMTDPKGNVTDFQYGANNRINSVITAERNESTTSYNSRNLVQRQVTAAGRTFDYEYDETGLPTAISTATETRAYGYDNNRNHNTTTSKPLGVSTAGISILRVYDELNRVTRIEFPREEKSVGYEYDVSGNLSAIVYPGDERVTYGYDQANRLTSVTDWANRVTTYTYDKNDRITDIVFPNGTRRVMTYDRGGQILDRADFTASGDAIVLYAYTYGPTGKILAEELVQAETPYQPEAKAFAYDEDNRAVSLNQEQIVFDADGNMTNAPFGIGPLEYDEYGNLEKAGGYTYSYDDEDHLNGWQTSASSKTEFTVNLATRAAQIIERTTPEGTLTRYVYGIGLLYEETDGATKTFHYDHRGSTVALSDDSGEVAGRVAYGPWGEVAASSGETDTLFLFNGMFGVITGPNGFNYMRYRWYAPVLNRFISQDAHYGSIAAAGTLNRFAYAGNDPISQIDPEGEFWWIITAAIGGAVNTAVTFVGDLVDDGQINSPIEDYSSAFLGGAAAGGILGVCPTCVVLAGSTGSATDYLFNKASKGETVVLADLALNAAAGGAFGKLGQVGGKYGSKFFSKIRGSKLPDLRRQGITSFNALLKRSAKEEFKQALKKVGFSVLATTVGPYVADIIAPTSPPSQRPNTTIVNQGLGELNAGTQGLYGEYLHWALYHRALQLADRSAPNQYNNAFARP